MGAADLLDHLTGLDLQGNHLSGIQGVERVPANLLKIGVPPSPRRVAPDGAVVVAVKQPIDPLPGILVAKGPQKIHPLFGRSLQGEGEMRPEPLEAMGKLFPAHLTLEIDGGLGAGQEGDGTGRSEPGCQIEEVGSPAHGGKGDHRVRGSGKRHHLLNDVFRMVILGQGQDPAFVGRVRLDEAGRQLGS